MSPVVTVVLPALLLGIAYVLGRRELRAFREGRSAYPPARLARRLVGVALVVALGATFAALGLAPPRSAGAASRVVGLIVAEVAALVALPIWEVAELARRRGTTRRGASRR